MTLIIDWSVFDKYPESTCECRSGHTFRSHAKTIIGPKGPDLISRKACPTCGTIALRSAKSDSETMTIEPEPAGEVIDPATGEKVSFVKIGDAMLPVRHMRVKR